MNEDYFLADLTSDITNSIDCINEACLEMHTVLVPRLPSFDDLLIESVCPMGGGSYE